MRASTHRSKKPPRGKNKWFMTSTGKLVNLDAVEYITPKYIHGRRWSVEINAEDYHKLCALLGFEVLMPDSPPPPLKANPPHATSRGNIEGDIPF